MELSSPESIRALMQAHGNPTPGWRRRGARDTVRPASKDRRMRCRCGQCHQCLDNARWERMLLSKLIAKFESYDGTSCDFTRIDDSYKNCLKVSSSLARTGARLTS